MKLRQLFLTYPHQWSILLLDFIGLYLCIYLAYSLRFKYSNLKFSWVLILFILITISTLYLFDSYQKEAPNRALKSIIKAVSAIVIAFLLITVYVYVIGRHNFTPLYGRGVLPVGFIFFIIWASLSRYLFCRVFYFKMNNNWLYIGPQDGAEWLKNENNHHNNKGNITYITNNLDLQKVDKQLEDDQTKSEWQNIIVYDFNSLPKTTQQLLIRNRTLGWPIYSFSEFVSRTWMKIPILHIEDQWIMDNGGFALLNDTLNIHSKKLLDLILAIISILIAFPIMLIICLLIPLFSKGPIFFKQKRIGVHGQEFTVYKFRTMTTQQHDSVAKWAQKNDFRVTKIGKTLRKYRLDELPQIINVFKGEMSFIGPRPEQPEFVEQLKNQIPYYNLRHIIKPGITGWAQVVYQYGASVEESKQKLEYDLYYIKNQSFMLDALIFAKTCKTIIYGQGH